MIGRTSLKIPTSKSVIADMMVVHNTGIKAGKMRVEIEVAEIKIDPIMKKENVTPSLEMLITGVETSGPLTDLRISQLHKLHLSILM